MTRLRLSDLTPEQRKRLREQKREADRRAQDLFADCCEKFGLPRPVAEFRFAPPRKWRFDFAWPDQKVALEVEGGVWTRGRHTRGAGFLRDMEKYNAATALGWRIIRTTPDEQYGRAIIDLTEVLRPATDTPGETVT